MQDPNQQIVIVIIAIIAVLLFFGILFLIMTWAYNNRRLQMEADKQQMKYDFDRQLLQSRLEIQEETFNHISQEIHDHVGQLLSLAKVQLSIIEETGIFNHGSIREARSTVGMALTELRDIAKGLSTERVQSLSLTENIDQLVKRINRSGVLEVQLTYEESENGVRDNKKLILFRMVQEVLQNVIKHANATQVQVECKCTTSQVLLSIHDNGTGFNVAETLKENRGLGLQHIMSRTAVMSGTVNITSRPECGTHITIIIPHVPE
ncbi:sensor histidine kinase [Chitinophaga eiseniae]|uniref:histidine kinase n=1 Tax=Chitinophaga eiseniae TaxID=634771 RepID=A0A847SKT3_9BACT|nr:ATP-binding protein [Chitinophaga eiseniae]NLR82511.1 hypothetical protein [Chitinophaga eiseniae]